MVEVKGAVLPPTSVAVTACAVGMEYDGLRVTVDESEGAAVTASAVGIKYDGASLVTMAEGKGAVLPLTRPAIGMEYAS